MQDFCVEYTINALGNTAFARALRPFHTVAVNVYTRGFAVQVGTFQLGFWQGKSATEICSRITGVASHTWDNNRDACDLMIAEHFFGVYYCVLVVAFLWVCRHCVFTVLHSAFSRQPVFNLQVDPRLLMLRA
jgi:hypothetical protein